MIRTYTNRILTACGAVMTLCLLTAVAPAAAKSADTVKAKDPQKIYMQLGTFPPFEIKSFNMGLENLLGDDEGSRSGLRSTGVMLSKDLNEYSALFAQSAAIVTTSLPEVTIYSRKDSGVVPLVVHLSNVVISNYSVNGSGDEGPVESMVLQFQEMIWRYTNQGPDGVDVEGQIVCSEPGRCVFVE